MLPQSESEASARLHRTQSSSSTHTTNPRYHAHRILEQDAIATRKCAEVAAVEAFQRAYPTTTFAACAEPSNLQRRRSQGAGLTEGSHLANARLGRRRSAAGRSEGGNRIKAFDQTIGGKCDERSAVVASQVVENKTNLASHNPSHQRRGATDENGSPTSRKYPELSSQKSSTPLCSSSQVPRGTYDGRLLQLSNFRHSTVQPTDSTDVLFQPAIRETQTDQDILAIARERCLRDRDAQHQVKPRKSLLFAPFQKRSSSALGKGNNFDRALPPFNMAGQGAAGLVDDAVDAVPSTTAHDARSRDASRSIRNRFKNVFRKASKLQQDIIIVDQPRDPIATKGLLVNTMGLCNSQVDEDPFVEHCQGDAARTVSSAHASVQDTTSRSRVTSWANSTFVGVSSLRSSESRASLGRPLPYLTRQSSMATLKKAGSFLSHPMAKRLSSSRLKCSSQSEGLYSALKDHINLQKSSASASGPLDVGSIESCDIPASRGYSVPVPSTLRRVTPEPSSRRPSIPPSITEVASPDSQTSCCSPPDAGKSFISGGFTDDPEANLQEQPASVQPVSAHNFVDQPVQCRQDNDADCRTNEVSEYSQYYRGERPFQPTVWTGYIVQPTPRRADSGIYNVQNPYQLSGLSETTDEGPANERPGVVDVHARSQLLSPSVYSRATDGITPRPPTPLNEGTTVITVTSREVKRYDISPSRGPTTSQRPVQGSGAWRKWFSDEMDGLQSGPCDLALPDIKSSSGCTPAIEEPTTMGKAESQHVYNADDSSIGDREQGCKQRSAAGSSSPLLLNPLDKKNLVGSSNNSKTSRYMNERYPMISTFRTSSRQSGKTVLRDVYAGSRQTSESPEAVAVAPRDNCRDFTLRKPSILGTFLNNSFSRSSQKKNDHATMGSQGPKDSHQDYATLGPTPNHAQSACNLRAKYSHGGLGTPKPLAIRRRAARTECSTSHTDSSTTSRVVRNGEESLPEAGNHLRKPYRAYSSTSLSSRPTGETGAGCSENSRPPGDSRLDADWSPEKHKVAGCVDDAFIHSGRRQHPQFRSPGQRMVTDWLHGRSEDGDGKGVVSNVGAANVQAFMVRIGN